MHIVSTIGLFLIMVVVVCFLREITETQAAMKSVEDSKSQLLVTTSELQTKLEAGFSVSCN